MSTKEAPINNTYLTDQELRHFKERLEEEQSKSRKKVDELKSRLEDLRGNRKDNQSSQDHHQGDLASAENTKTTLLASLESENKKMNQITVALDRIETGNYGICVETGRKIQKGRLEAMPHAIRSVVAKSEG